MGPTSLRADAPEAALIGAATTEATIGSATALAANGTTPPTDLSCHADCREHLARVLAKRAVLTAATRTTITGTR
jgi:aerobic carbon-monoxide dehydrogenase medium subunit